MSLAAEDAARGGPGPCPEEVTLMRTVAIVSPDEMNRAEAAAWAAELGLDAVWLYPYELAAGAAADAVVCDWEFWPEPDRRRVLAWPRGPGARLVLKAYDPAPDEAERLARAGAVVWPRWERDLFRHVGTLLAGAPPAPAPLRDFAPAAGAGTAADVCFRAAPAPPEPGAAPAVGRRAAG